MPIVTRATDETAEVTESGSAADVMLLERVRRGDREAAALLFERFKRLVNHTVRRVLGPDPEHDDVVYETFLRAVAGVHKVRSAEKLSSWMLSVTLNTVRSELRARQRRRQLFVGQSRDEPAAGREVDLEGQALVARVFAILEQMRLEERLVFSLHYIDEQSIPQVAESCGCSPRTVKRRLQRARKHFVARAQRDPDLAERIAAGGRWVELESIG